RAPRCAARPRGQRVSSPQPISLCSCISLWRSTAGCQVTRDTSHPVACPRMVRLLTRPYISGPMTRRFTRLAWTAAIFTYLLILLGAVTVKLSLPPWTVILHLGTAMLLLATLMVAARGRPSAPPSRAGLYALALGFVTLLLGALTANLGAASACLGFPLCNGQIFPAGNYLPHVHWFHRLLAYTLFGYAVWWALRTRTRGAWCVVALVTLQVAVAAA